MKPPCSCVSGGQGDRFRSREPPMPYRAQAGRCAARRKRQAVPGRARGRNLPRRAAELRGPCDRTAAPLPASSSKRATGPISCATWAAAFGRSAWIRSSAARAGHNKTYNFFLSHLHWDHIMGFPFFAPAFDPDAIIRIHAGHPDAEQALRRQQEEISFPVPFDWLRAKISFVQLTPGETYEVDGVAGRNQAAAPFSRAAMATASPTATGGSSSTARTASTSLRR